MALTFPLSSLFSKIWRWGTGPDVGNIRTVPVNSASATAASFENGFPILTATPIALGGIPPAQDDFNGILQQITANQQWANAGGQWHYSSAMATAIGGYPQGAILQLDDNVTSVIATSANVMTDPNSDMTGWKVSLAERVGTTSGCYINSYTIPSGAGTYHFMLSGSTRITPRVSGNILLTLFIEYVIVYPEIGVENGYTLLWDLRSGTSATPTAGDAITGNSHGNVLTQFVSPGYLLNNTGGNSTTPPLSICLGPIQLTINEERWINFGITLTANSGNLTERIMSIAARMSIVEI